MANNEGSIKVSKANKLAFDNAIIELGGAYTQDEAFSFLLGLYASYKAEKAIATKAVVMFNENGGMKKGNISVTDKLHLFVNTIMEHNAKEFKQKTRNYIYIQSVYFLHIETGINKSRDCSPFMKSVEQSLNAHYEKYNINVSCMSNPLFAQKDEKGRIEFITEVLTKAEIASIFGR
jgi:hypothetical protein